VVTRFAFALIGAFVQSEYEWRQNAIDGLLTDVVKQKIPFFKMKVGFSY
jgi:hypothetical protein